MRLALLLAGALGGCALSLEAPNACEVQTDCLDGRVCVDNQCVPAAKACRDPACKLYAITPATAEIGDTVELNGIFGSTLEVKFPGRDGGVAPSSLNGHRALVRVPSNVESGYLTASSEGVTLGPQPFARLDFEPAVSDTRPEQISGARSPSRLQKPRARQATAQRDIYVYAVGGEASDGTPLDHVERATLNADGTLSTFSYYRMLCHARAGAAAVVIGDWLVVAGGVGADGKPLDTVETMHLDDGVCHDEGKLSEPRSDAAAFAIGNRMVLAGGRGRGGVLLSTVESVAVDGAGKLKAPATEPSLESPRARAAALAANGALWLIGGEDDKGALTSIERGELRDARVLRFSTGGKLENPRAGGRAALVGRYVFLAGGEAGGAPIAAIERATVGDATLVFDSAGSLRRPRSDAGLVVQEFGLALAGGRDEGGVLADVERLPLDGKAALGAFAYTDPLPDAREGMRAVALGRNLYLLGGRHMGPPTTELFRAEVKPGGALGGFEQLRPLNKHRYRAMIAVTGNWLHIIGGDTRVTNGIVPEAISERAPIFPDGSLGSFEEGPRLNEARSDAAAVVLGDYLYIFGGRTTGSTVLDSVERAHVDENGLLESFERVTVSPRLLERNGAAQISDGDHVYLGGGATITGTPLQNLQHIRWDGTEIHVDQPMLELPRTRDHPGSVSVGARWYFLGGYTNFVDDKLWDKPLQTLDLATLDASGVLSSTTQLDAMLLNPRNNPTTIRLGSWAYAMGGRIDRETDHSTIERAPLVKAN